MVASMLVTLKRTFQRVNIRRVSTGRPNASSFSSPTGEENRIVCTPDKLSGEFPQENRKALRNQLLKLIKVDKLVRAAISLDEFAENSGNEQSMHDLTHLLGSIAFDEKVWLSGVISFDEYKRGRNLQRLNLLSILNSLIPTSNRS